MKYTWHREFWMSSSYSYSSCKTKAHRTLCPKWWTSTSTSPRSSCAISEHCCKTSSYIQYLKCLRLLYNDRGKKLFSNTLKFEVRMLRQVWNTGWIGNNGSTREWEFIWISWLGAAPASVLTGSEMFASPFALLRNKITDSGIIRNHELNI